MIQASILPTVGYVEILRGRVVSDGVGIGEMIDGLNLAVVVRGVDAKETRPSIGNVDPVQISAIQD